MGWLFFNESFTLTASVFERALSVLNLIVFVSSFVQYEGLISSKGIAPAELQMARVRRRGLSFWQYPTLGFLSTSDSALLALHIAGMAASVSAFFGFFTGLSILVAAVCYCSLKNVSGPFLGLQMHANLVETDALYVVASPFLLYSPKPLILLQTALVSRVMLGGALGKWTGGDRSWRDLTAMSFHYWTQPLPNRLSPYFHRLPLWLHKLESAATFVLEGVGAVLCFSPLPTRIVAFFCFAAILTVINVSGNYGFLAQMTMTEALCLLNDDVLLWLLHSLLPAAAARTVVRFLLWSFHSPWSLSSLLRIHWLLSLPPLSVLPYLPVLLYLLLGIVPIASTCNDQNPLQLLAPITPAPLRLYERLVATPAVSSLMPHVQAAFSQLQAVYPRFQAFDIALRYVKFGHMTKRRYELILQTSRDGRHWHELPFIAKPTLTSARPPFLGPHIPMLDWRLWFLGNEHARGLGPPDWYLRLMQRVLEGEEAVLRLLSREARERVREGVGYVRTLVFDYRFVYGSEQDAADREAEDRRRKKRRQQDEEEDEDAAEEGEREGLSDWRLVRRRGKEEDDAGNATNVVRPGDFWYSGRHTAHGINSALSVSTVPR